MANPSTRWDFVPVFGVYLRLDDSPSAGKITFTMPGRITRVDGRVIYPEGASVTVTIGDTAQQDSAIRSAVRAAWRAADQAAQGAGFDGVAWDTWWDDVVVPAAIFASFPAADDPDIVQQGWSVSVSEGLTSSKGRSYAIQPLLAHLDQPIPGINLGTIEVPPSSPTVPAPMYAKGIAGGVAALDADGDVVDAGGNKVAEAAMEAIAASIPDAVADYLTANPPSGGGESVVISATPPASGWWLEFAAPAADATAPAWSATLTTGTPAATSVVVAASALATDAMGVTGYERSLDGGSTWAAVTPSGLNFTLSGLTAATSYPAPKLRAKDAAGNYSTPLTAQAFTTASGGDVTNPNPGTLASSAITATGFTLTVTGASDAGGLHATTPYAYSTNNGSTWSAWQAGATFSATGLAASTAYQARHKVRDAAGNEATGSAITVTTGASIPEGTIAIDAFDRADGPIGTADLGGAWVNASGRWQVYSNRARCYDGASGDRALVACTAADVEVSVKILAPGTTGDGVVARCPDTTTGTFYLGRAKPGVVELYRFVDGTAAIVGSLVHSWVAGDTITLRVSEGAGQTDLALLVNGVSKVTYADTATTRPSTSAYVGLRAGGSGNPMFDDFSATAY